MISGIELKRILYNEPNLIKKLLESFGCRHIHKSNKRISSTRPDADAKNRNSVNVILNETLNAKIYTRQSEFEQYEIQDIISLTQYFLKCSFEDAINYICSTCGIENSGTYVKQEDSPTLSFLKRYKKIIRNENTTDDVILDDKILDLFIHAPCKIFTDDGIDIPTQERFGIAYDILNNRVIFPIRNDKGELVNIKGRTLFSDYKLLGIQKYLYYYDLSTNHLLFGEFEFKDYIKNSNEIILVESEKSVMKAYQYGYYNVLATSKKSISRQQRNKLLSYGKPICICYDNDVSEGEIKVIAKIFKGLVPISYVIDEYNWLDEKDSPLDKGKEVFKKLLENKISFS